MSGSWEIQKAVYLAVSGASAVTDLIATVVDFGQGKDDGSTIYPYISVGDIILGEYDTDNSDGFDADIRIHTWTNTGSAKLVKAVQDAIYGVLHKKPLNVTGFDTINVYRVDSDVSLASGGAHHGVCEYRGLFDKT